MLLTMPMRRHMSFFTLSTSGQANVRRCACSHCAGTELLAKRHPQGEIGGCDCYDAGRHRAVTFGTAARVQGTIDARDDESAPSLIVLTLYSPLEAP